MVNSKKLYTLFGVVIVVILIFIILLVTGPKTARRNIAFSMPQNDTFAQTRMANNHNDPPQLTDDILTIINNDKITKQQFDSMFNAMPSQIKEYYKDDKPGFLDELITRQLLIQEAKRQKIDQQADYKEYVKQNPDKKEDIMVNLLLRKITSNITISENELRNFYNQYKDQLPNKEYESVKEQLKPMAMEEKQRLAIEEFINNLKAKAKIVRNEKWIKEQEELTVDNPLSKALKSGRPVLADFGRGTCIPCKMMQPILEKLQKKYEGKAEILIIDVGEYPSLARKYKIMMIPTQIFFNSSGKEVYRHQGFMPEQDIVTQMKKLNVSE